MSLSHSKNKTEDKMICVQQNDKKKRQNWEDCLHAKPTDACHLKEPTNEN